LINEPRDFSVEELFFSTTDSKGHILRANSVFRGIAGYSWEELENKPHNIIRHPDMPRIVFQTLWDYIQDGRPIVAYVKNLAHDGRYYWVVALVVPAARGYLSVRFKPTSPLRAPVELLYTELRAVEAAIESEGGAGKGNDRKAAIAASREVLGTSLRALGFNGYDDFMRHVLKVEMQSREAALRAVPAAIKPDAATRSAMLDSLWTAAEEFDKLVEVLNVLFADLETYVEINKDVRDKSGKVTDISESLRVSALNGAIEADRLGARAAGLRPVLDWLRVLSLEITKEGARLAASLVELVRDIDLVVFDLSAAKLQIEMTAQFAHELFDHALARMADPDRLWERRDQMTEGAIESLHESSCETVRRALGSLAAIRDRLRTLTESQDKLIASSRSLRPIYLTGKIEMAEGGGPRLATVFKDVGEQLEETAADLAGLKQRLEDLEGHLVRGLAHGERVEEAISRIDAQMNATVN